MLIHMPNYIGKWELLPGNEKSAIKINILSTLASKEKDIRKAAALVVAGKLSLKKGICKIEIPRKDWPDIIDILVSNCSNENENFRLSSIITLGYISQEVSPKDLTTEEIDKILTGILKNLNSQNNKISSAELESTAIVALINYVSFAKKNFSFAEERALIMDTVYFNLGSSNLEMRVFSMQCLVEITRCFYDFLGDQMAKILELTILHMEKDDEKVAIQAYELWCSLSDEENARLREISSGAQVNCNNYCQIASDTLFRMIQYHLLHRKNNEGDEWTLSKAAASLISNLSQCCSYPFIEEVAKFVAQKMNDNDPKIRDSSIMAFTSILETKYKENIRMMIINALDSLLAMITDSNREVRESVSWCIEKICEQHTSCFVRDSTRFRKIYQTIKENIPKGKKMGVHLCNALHYIAKSLRVDENKTSII
jgi:importin subunit beta-1